MMHGQTNIKFIITIPVSTPSSVNGYPDRLFLVVITPPTQKNNASISQDRSLPIAFHLSVIPLTDAVGLK
jgi:hypothetical protein